jgi:hypothetical protein
MSSGSGTLITDLDTASSVSDTDIVAQIMADMNAPASSSQQQQQYAAPTAPPMPISQSAPMQMQQPTHMINAGPMPNSMLQNTIDPNVATAHIIGNRQPTPADFAALMGAPISHPGYAMPAHASMAAPVEEKSLGSLIGNNWLRELKTPILVAIIFCVMSLPVINVMIGHYFPRLLRIGGDLTMTGLGVKSLMAGALFFIIQRVLVPLVTN